jgi:hypothetical protein
MSSVAGFRLNPEEDADIIKDLDRFKNRSKRMRELMRKGLEYENTYLKFTERNPITEKDIIKVAEALEKTPSMLVTPEPIEWKIPVEPSVKPKSPGGLKANILKNNF